ncbi:unnamed protein product [Dicrocoelium dendriticum]|nr:unnamed protein product [Dicrocoelium dendriticum]
MTIQNLASVFAPNVLRPVDCDLDVEMAASPIISLTVAELIRCHAQLFRLHLAPRRFAAANGSVVSTQRRQKLVRRRRSHHTADTILLPPPPYHTPPQPILGHRAPESNGDIEDNCRSWIQRPAQQKFRAIPRDWPPGVDPNIPPELCRQMDVWNEKTGYSDNTGKLHFIGTYDNIMPENLSVQTPYPAVSTFYERDSRLPYGPREIFENLRPTNHDNLTFSLDKSHSDSLPHPRMNRSVTAHSHLNGIQRSTQHQDRRPCNAPAGCGVVTQADDSALSSSYSSDFESLRLWHDKTRLSNRTVNSPIRTFTLNTHTAPHNFVEYPAYSKISTVPFLTQKPYSDSDASLDRCVKPDHKASTLIPGCTAVNPISAEDQTQYWQTLAIRARAEAAGQRARAHSLSRELKKVQCDLNMARLEIRLLRQGLANSGDYTAVDSYQNPGNLRHRANNGIWPS